MFYKLLDSLLNNDKKRQRVFNRQNYRMDMLETLLKQNKLQDFRDQMILLLNDYQQECESLSNKHFIDGFKTSLDTIMKILNKQINL